jgi:hypothetical protein
MPRLVPGTLVPLSIATAVKLALNAATIRGSLDVRPSRQNPKTTAPGAVMSGSPPEELVSLIDRTKSCRDVGFSSQGHEVRCASCQGALDARTADV